MPDDSEILLETARFRVERRQERLADGSIHRREVVVHPGAVAIVPLLDSGRICLIRNFRVAVGQELIELPAGTIEPNEPPLETARRELAEETGYRAGRIERLGEFWVSPGILNERMHLFVASDLQPGPTAPEAGERIRPLPVELAEAIRMIADGRIQDAKTIVGLLLYDRLRSDAPH